MKEKELAEAIFKVCAAICTTQKYEAPFPVYTDLFGSYFPTEVRIYFYYYWRGHHQEYPFLCPIEYPYPRDAPIHSRMKQQGLIP